VLEQTVWIVSATKLLAVDGEDVLADLDVDANLSEWRAVRLLLVVATSNTDQRVVD
jgi:hypothetical protein